MTARAARVLLLALLVTALAGAGAYIAREEAAAAADRGSAREFDLETVRLASALKDIRTGQQAYVAPGQDDAWWRKKVATAFQAALPSLETLRRTATSPDTMPHLDAAREALATLEQTDKRAARLVGVGDLTQAAVAVLTDGLAAAGAAESDVEAARQSEQQALDRRLQAVRRRQAMAAAGAGLLALLVALALAPRIEVPVSQPAADAPPTRQPAVPGPSGDAPTVDPRAPAAPEAGLARPVLVSDSAAVVGIGDAWPARDRRKAPDLRAAADLCTDFARVADGGQLPVLLERAADLLDATGIIVWLADPSQQELRPVLAHGFTPHSLQRLPAIPVGSDNATAAAFRHARVEVVKANGMSPGALVVPLLAPEGCFGVVAAEVRHGREASESARALARLIAAQLATLLAVASAEAGAPAPQTT
jgi:hypothetical protein